MRGEQFATCKIFSTLSTSKIRMGVEKKVFVKPNEQYRACSYIVMVRIRNRQHGALSEVERQNALFEEQKRRSKATPKTTLVS